LVNSLLRGAVWSVLIGLVVVCALEFASLLFDAASLSRRIPALFASPLLDHLAKGAVVAMGVMGLAILVAFLRTGDLAAHARAADRKFDLKERLATAFEVASAGPQGAAQNPVCNALLADAEQRARSIDVRALVPLRLSRAAWAMPALLALAFLLEAAPPDLFRLAAPRPTTERNAAVDKGLSGQEAADAAANLRRIAEILEQDAAQRSDPYLRTLARTLDRLSAEVAAAKIDRPRLTSELNSLLAHAQRAYGQSEQAADAG